MECFEGIYSNVIFFGLQYTQMYKKQLYAQQHFHLMIIQYLSNEINGCSDPIEFLLEIFGSYYVKSNLLKRSN